ncbi:uncharacterized protein LAJ45_06492 [Morchella importuna]|uniref:uncharacterized protein n=1 Tax=Morchella importuna TaxID=1174673 RepID=UPI001E8D4772|nr:uncharacterized protein LAJ45_06492 [Morchella importuna]KAH8149413.1 hypothetical protein LAJ45_06492 [Morchella importuna]
MLSTPQKVLRDTLRERVDSSSSKDASSHPDIDDNNNNNNINNNHVDESSTDEDDDRGMEMRREALRQRGRESYAKRKESSTVGTNTAPVITRGSRRTGASESFMDRINAISNEDDDDDNDDDDGEDIFFNESRSKLRPDNEKKPPQPRKKRKPDTGNGDSAYIPPHDDEASETEEDEPYLEPEPGSGKRKASSSQRPPMDSSPQLPMRQTSPSRTKATRVNSTSTTGTVVSRFKEGSMRNRASVVPPVEIIGKLPSSSPPPRTDDMPNGIGGESNVFSFGSGTEKPGAEAMAAAAAAGNHNNDGSFTLGGMASLIPFNPFKFVKGIKESWDRQKRFQAEREQQKKELRERRIKGLLAYEEFKRMGALQGYAGNAAAVMGAQSKAKNSASSLGPIRVERDQIGRAFNTDQQSSPLARNNSKVRRKKKSTRTPSVGVDASMTGMAQSFCEGRESYVDEHGTLHRYSVDSKYMSPQGSFNRRMSTSKPITPKTGAMGPPPPIPSSSRANGGDFEDARILPKKKSSVFSVFGGRSEDSKELQKLKRQEHLQKKGQCHVSTRIGNVPSMMSDETDEGDKTEVDDDHAAPLSPLANAGSIGGSFMAKTAGMTIVENSDEQAQQQQAGEPVLPDIPLPKKAPKSSLSGRRRVISSSAAGSSSASATAAALKHQGSMPAISRVRKGSSKVEAIPPVHKFTNGG